MFGVISGFLSAEDSNVVAAAAELLIKLKMDKLNMDSKSIIFGYVCYDILNILFRQGRNPQVQRYSVTH